MSEFFVGRGARLLLDETGEGSIRIRKMNLEQPEFGHMSCRMDDRLHFLYMTEGEMTCQINQETVRISDGEGLFINRGNAFRFNESKKGGCEFYLIDVTGEYLGAESFVGEKYVKPILEAETFLYVLLNAEDGEELLGAVENLGKIAEEEDICRDLEARSAMLHVWAELYRLFTSRDWTAKKAVLREKEKLWNMLTFLHEHYREKITLGEMAKNSEVSSGEYCRFFKKRMEQTPFEYLQAYRIEKSLPEILDKTGSITEIALRHGFTGSSYFAETFRKEMGCAPLDYRKWYRGETEGECPLKVKGETAPSKAVEKPVEKAAEKAPRRESMPAHLL